MSRFMNRRQFASSLMAAVTLPMLGRPGLAMPPQRLLKALKRTIEVNGKAASVFGLMQADGTHGLRLAPGEDFNVRLVNTLDAPTLIHWHGLTPPWAQDGVPDMPAKLMLPGEARDYSFAPGKPGTHWMHAHTLQEQGLLAAPLVVQSPEDQASGIQDHVVLLHDFSFTSAEELLSRLTSGKGMMSHGDGAMQMDMSKMDHNTMNHSAMNHGEAGGMADGMVMDINDINFDAYLANDRALDDPEIVQVEKGGRLRLRLINGATATGFLIDVGSLAAEIIAVDGQDTVPLAVKQVPLTMGQRVDLLLQIPKEGGAFPVLALREGAAERTGLILSTPGAGISKLPSLADSAAPALDLGVELQLKARHALTPRVADRSFSVMIMGDMASYQWSLQSSTKLVVKEGERVAIEMMNHSMMSHPMHLHGHHFQVTAINGRQVDGALRDTVLVPPMATVSIAFDANNPGGGWAFHCHNLYHMASGMMSFIGYAGY